jgi:histone deacetylase complex regulatory component SIN3
VKRVALHVLTPTGALRAAPALLLTVVAFGLALALTIGYVAAARARDDRRWCALLDTISQPQPSTPPQTPQEARGRRVTEQIRQLRTQFGCGR